MAARLRVIALLVVAFFAISGHAQSILHRKVKVHAQDIRLADALALIAREGRFKLSYNAGLVNGDSLVSVQMRGTVREALHHVVGREILLTESGEHIILLPAGTKKDRVRITGMVTDVSKNEPVSGATVHELHENPSVRTDGSGRFAMEASGKRDPIPLRITHQDYRDTVVYVARNSPPYVFTLRPLERIERLEMRCLNDRCVTLEELGLARFLVSAEQMGRAINTDVGERRGWQLSLVPSVGTNGLISGAVVNRLSINILAGYSGGLDGTEFACGVNMERRDVKGVQVAGLANLVGRDTRGVQVAGGMSHTLRSVDGLQLSGLANTVWDTLTGLQVAGGLNAVKGGMLGTQVSGLGNMAMQNCEGVQVAGGFNAAKRDLQGTQVAGVLNYGRNVYGAQVAGGVNVAPGEVGGGQVAAVLNVARKVFGGQVTGGVNLAMDTVHGGQVGLVNMGRAVMGRQVGLLNFSDTIAGNSFGLLSIAWRGYHRLDVAYRDVSAFTLSFRTGTRIFHNIIQGALPIGGYDQWMVGYGFGTEPRIGERSFLDVALTLDYLFDRTGVVEDTRLLGRFSVAFGREWEGKWLLSGGPSFNMLYTIVKEPGSPAALPNMVPKRPWIAEQGARDWRHGWLGWSLAAGFRF